MLHPAGEGKNLLQVKIKIKIKIKSLADVATSWEGKKKATIQSSPRLTLPIPSFANRKWLSNETDNVNDFETYCQVRGRLGAVKANYESLTAIKLTFMDIRLFTAHLQPEKARGAESTYFQKYVWYYLRGRMQCFLKAKNMCFFPVWPSLCYHNTKIGFCRRQFSI